MPIFTDSNHETGSAVTPEMIAEAEARLGRKLPAAYVALLHERNGGEPANPCFRVRGTTWAPDHLEVSAILGVGDAPMAIDSEFGSAYMIAEWGYPDIGIVIGYTPSGGHDCVMLDYRECGADDCRENGAEQEPGVVYIHDDRSIIPLAPNFSMFLSALEPRDRFPDEP